MRRALEAMAAAPGASRTAKLVSIYYDTPDHALARRGSCLRVRRSGRRFVQTFKTAGAPNGDSMLSRGEWEDRVAGERPDPNAAQSGAFLSPELVGKLRPLFRTEVSRVTIQLAPGPATAIEAAIDRGRIRDGENTPPQPISEVELELKHGAPAALYDVALELLRVAPLRLERRSKAERGYLFAAHAPVAPRAVHAEPLDLSGDISAATALTRFGRGCLDHLLRNEEAALAGDADGIHQMRVAVRRLRAALSAFAPLLPKDQRRWAGEQLRWLADALGDARNLDVFTVNLLRPARAALPEASEFERLSRGAERKRRSAHAAAAEAIASVRFTAAMLALLRWFDGRDAGAAMQQPIAAVAPALLDRCRHQAAKRAKGFAHQSATKRHRLRIALKKLRYAAELLGSLYEPAQTRQFIQRVKRLQDDLGDEHDVRVARDIVAGLSDAPRRSTGIAHAGHRMLAWHKRRLAKNEPLLRRHLDELLATPPFWRSEPAAAPAQEAAVAG